MARPFPADSSELEAARGLHNCSFRSPQNPHTQLPSSAISSPPLSASTSARARIDKKRSSGCLGACVMAKEYQGEELWLPSAFFLEGGGGPKNGGETVDDEVAGLAQQMARYFFPDAAPVAAPQHAKVGSCLSCWRFFFLPPLQIQ
ncbi:hypothetical protein BHE74_00005403 [Ensete ventricosum]|nr:hypothetical protein BHE74_00005403 [Ensete ventricosum]RZR81270.1 hypothetical protein BHM03_00007463 [Ensete ventricosum]